MMRKGFFITFFLALSVSSLPQKDSHLVTVTNIEVPVRVYKGDEFVDNLSLEDFELYEEGIPQKIEAVYLIKRTSITREEGEKKFKPEVSRHFVLLFQLYDYVAELHQAIDYFVEKVISPRDTLTVITPLKSYNLKSLAFQVRSRAEIASQLNGIVRRDIEIGGSEYRSVIRELEASISDLNLEFPLEQKLMVYNQVLNKLENMRFIDQKKLLEFARFLKAKEGQKYVFLFYQKELVPKISFRAYQNLVSENMDRMDTLLSLMELFEFFKREITFDVNVVKQAFADSFISSHFLMMTKTKPLGLDVERQVSPSETGFDMEEQSEDIFSAFREIADATGGVVLSSANPASSFKEAAEAAETYYLLYYTPHNYKKDGKFRRIEVKVKAGKFRITHRAGYIAS